MSLIRALQTESRLRGKGRMAEVGSPAEVAGQQGTLLTKSLPSPLLDHLAF